VFKFVPTEDMQVYLSTCEDGGSAFHTVLEVFESNFGSAVACASHDPEPYGCPHTNAVIRDLAVRAHMVYWIVLAGAVEECGDFTFTLTSLHAPPKGWRSPAPALPRIIPSAPTPRIAAAAAAAKNSPPLRPLPQPWEAAAAPDARFELELAAAGEQAHTQRRRRLHQTTSSSSGYAPRQSCESQR
jgi:hypothetical protein